MLGIPYNYFGTFGTQWPKISDYCYSAAYRSGKSIESIKQDQYATLPMEKQRSPIYQIGWEIQIKKLIYNKEDHLFIDYWLREWLNQHLPFLALNIFRFHFQYCRRISGTNRLNVYTSKFVSILKWSGEVFVLDTLQSNLLSCLISQIKL